MGATTSYGPTRAPAERAMRRSGRGSLQRQNLRLVSGATLGSLQIKHQPEAGIQSGQAVGRQDPGPFDQV